MTIYFNLCAGIELASSCGRAQGERGAALMLITTATGMSLGNTALGFLAGEPRLSPSSRHTAYDPLRLASCCAMGKSCFLKVLQQ